MRSNVKLKLEWMYPSIVIAHLDVTQMVAILLPEPLTVLVPLTG